MLFAILAIEAKEGARLWSFLCLYALAYPFAVQAWANRTKHPRRTLRRLVRADLVHSGVGIAGLGFALIPSLYVIGVNLINTAALGGLRDLPQAILLIALGALLGHLLFGTLPDPKNPTADLAAVIGLVLYNIGLGAIVHHVTGQLRAATKVLHLQSAALAEASRTDPLTGVRNRRDLVLWLAESGHQEVGYVLFDLDHFKAINDRYGHAIGDRVLAEFARRLVHRFGQRARVLRWGGEEFLLAWPQASAALLRRELDAFLADLSTEPMPLDDGVSIRIHCSVGAVPADAALGWERALALADQALYRAKAMGRGCACIHDAREIDCIATGPRPPPSRPGLSCDEGDKADVPLPS